MRYDSFIFALVLSLSVVVSCKNSTPDEKLAKSIITELSGIDVNDHVIIIIPQDGCPSCISAAFDFINIDLLEPQNIHIIFTNITDKKMLRAKLSKANQDQPHIILDEKSLWVNNGLYSIYPEIFTFEGGKIKEYVLANTENKSIWSVLKQRML